MFERIGEMKRLSSLYHLQNGRTRGIDHELWNIRHDLWQQGLGHQVEPCQAGSAGGGCLTVTALSLVEGAALMGRIAGLPRRWLLRMLKFVLLQRQQNLSTQAVSKKLAGCCLFCWHITSEGRDDTTWAKE